MVGHGFHQLGFLIAIDSRLLQSAENAMTKPLMLPFQLNKQLNKTITEQIKMEYYLSLKDNLKDVDSATQRRRIRELKDYIEEINEVAFNRKHLISDIERVLNEVTATV